MLRLGVGGWGGGRRKSGLRQRVGRPLTHISQCPQNTDRQQMTWSPGFTYVTWSPTASTIPAASWARIGGGGSGYSPSTKCRSLWQTPEATVWTMTSRAIGLSISTLSMVSGWWGPWNMAAFIDGSLLL